MHDNLMIDLETIGKGPDAPVLAIGAVFFTPETGDIGESFYTPVYLGSEMERGAVPDADTILWWMKQSDEARAAISTDHAPTINHAMHAFNKFVKDNCPAYKKMKVWGNGAGFDNVILRQACKRAGVFELWNFWNDRDVRTIVDLGRMIGFDPKKDMPFEGERHNALDDAIHQAKYVSAIWQKLFTPHQL